MSAPEALTVWVGLDPGRPAPPARGPAAPDVDHAARYELIAANSRISEAAAYLAAADIAGGRAVGSELAAVVDAIPGRFDEEELGVRWAARYHEVARIGPAESGPYAIYLVGVNPPNGASAEELAEFDTFYTNVHMPEVVERRHCLGAIRYAFDDLVGPTETRCPFFLTAYELDQRAASIRSHIGGAYSSGPDVWKRHTTPWRHWYRLLAP